MGYVEIECAFGVFTLLLRIIIIIVILNFQLLLSVKFDYITLLMLFTSMPILYCQIFERCIIVISYIYSMRSFKNKNKIIIFIMFIIFIIIITISLGYGFAMGQLFYVRELAPNGPAINCGEIQPGDRVIEVNDE